MLYVMNEDATDGRVQFQICVLINKKYLNFIKQTISILMSLIQ